MKKLVLFAGVLVALSFASCNSAKQEAPATDAPEAVEAMADECCGKCEADSACCGKCESDSACCGKCEEKAEGECCGKCENDSAKCCKEAAE